MKNKNLWLYGIIAFTILFIASAIIFRVYNIEILPSQFYGALIGVVITAIITVFLLNGQSKAEENKERNVKVFEAKSKRYNNFINKLWEIWEDRYVSLEELNELIKLVSKDIIIYSKPDTVKTILEKLNEIADITREGETSELKDVTFRVQNNIFDIIDVLSKEIGLGGELNAAVRNELNNLEEKIIPYVQAKKYKEDFFLKLNESLESKNIDYVYKDNYVCIEVIPNIEVRYGPLERKDRTEGTTECFIFLSNNFKEFNHLRHMTRGWGRERLKDSTEWFKESFNFQNIQLTNQLASNKDFSLVDKIVKQLEKSMKNEMLNQIVD